MDFKLNIGKLTETIAAYDKILEKLSEEKEEINNALNRLYEEGWFGQARDKFEEVHKKKQLLYSEVEENIKYLKDILENEEKPRAVELKKRSEDFVNKVARGGGGSGAVTSDDEGIISLLYSGVDKLDSIIDNCTDNYYNRMERQYDYVDELLGQLCYTSFGIGGDIDECHAAVQEQTHNLIDFRDSLGAYNQCVIEMEDNLVSKLSFIQESTNTSFKTDYDSGVSEDAEIMLIYISLLLTKRIDELSEDEKAYLENVENMLGVEDYKKLKELIWSFVVAKIQNVHVMDEKKLDEKFDRVKELLENERILRMSFPNIQLISKEDEDNEVFDFIKSSASKSWDSFKKIASDLWKGVEIRGSKWNDSPYNFINWLTLGLPDTVKSLGEMNYQNGLKAFDTGNVYDIGNWLTMN